MTIEPLSSKYVPYVAQIIKERWEISDEETNREIARWMSDADNSICFVGIVEGMPVGFGLFDVQSKVDASIDSWNRQLFVEPAHRGSDYGHQLTLARFAWAQSKGYESVYLSTEAAKDYHLRFGWEIIREEVKSDKTITIMRYDFKKPLTILSLNCQKGYQPTLKPFLQKILSESSYDFLLLQEADSTVISALTEFESGYGILHPFDNELGEHTHECIVYKKAFTLRQESLISFARLNPKMPARGWGCLIGVFEYGDTDIVLGSLHLHPGLGTAIRAQEMSIVKEHIIKYVGANRMIVFGGDCNFGLPGEISRSEKILSPEFLRVTRGLGATLDSRYTEKASWGIARVANMLTRLGISIKCKTDQLYVDKMTVVNRQITCRIIPDRVSDHLAIEMEIKNIEHGIIDQVL